MQEPRWTLDELAERVDGALAVDYAGPPSGRVRAVPDRRAIRWYTTIGLIDRPVAHRGRTALYGPRHLLQLVAVKRLQASGLPLVDIQRELAGATDTQLARVARLPVTPAARDRASASRATAGAALAGPDGAPAAAGRVGRPEFWRGQAANYLAAHASPDPAARVGAPDAGLPVATLPAIRLGEGATLLLAPGPELGAADIQAILDAARPLLATLRERGLGQVAEGGPRREHP